MQAREEIGILRVDKEDYQQRVKLTNTELQHTKKRMLELRNDLSTLKGRFELAETKLAQEEAESASLRRRLKEQEDELVEMSKKIEEEMHGREEEGREDEEALTSRGIMAEEVKELRQKLVETEEKLALATQKALDIEKEKGELFNSFLAQVSQTSLMEQRLFEEKQQLQMKLDGTMLQLQESRTGQHTPLDGETVNSEQPLEIDEMDKEHENDKERADMDDYDHLQVWHSNEPGIGVVPVPETLTKKLLEEKDTSREEKNDEDSLDVQQVPSEKELKLQETINELTMKLRATEDLPTKEAYSQAVDERDRLREKLESIQSKIKDHNEAEKQLRREVDILHMKLSTTRDYAAKMKMKLENELEKSNLTSQLEAKLMESTCVMSQVTGEKVQLQFKVKGLQQQLQASKEETRKLNDKLSADLSEKGRTIDQLATEKEELLRKVLHLQKLVQETCQQQFEPQTTEPQINDKDVVSYEEIKLTQNMLGTGAWGYVVKGRFRGKVVAVKCLHKDILSQFSKAQVQREVSIMAELHHPNLVLFIAAVMDAPSGPMIITELLSYTLRRAYQEKIITGSVEKMLIMQEVALALNYLHLRHKPIIHRDISSANVLLEELADKKWRAKLSDFGSANLVRLASTPGEGALVYSAPEMRTGAHKPQAPAADVYSYGVLFCEVMTACFPNSSNLREMMETVRSQSRIVSEIIASCLSECPSDRPAMGLVIAQLDVLISTRTNN